MEFNSVSDRTAELMFEKYKVPALFLAKNAVSGNFFAVLSIKKKGSSLLYTSNLQHLDY